MMDRPEVKTAVDVISLSTIVGALIDALPHVAALLSVIWGAIRIYETATVQRWLKGEKHDRRRKQ